VILVTFKAMAGGSLTLVTLVLTAFYINEIRKSRKKKLFDSIEEKQ
jgi:hypothetical protein